MRVCRSSTATFASGLVEGFKVSPRKYLLVLLRLVAVRGGRNVPGTNLWQTFVKSGKMMEGYISPIQHVHVKRIYQKSSRM